MADVLILRSRLRPVGSSQVRRLLPAAKKQAVGPFLFFDHFGPEEHEPFADYDVRPHPHIGLSTVTYLFEGAMVAHSERAPEELKSKRRRTHGLQLWAGLPKSREDRDPGFAHTSHRAIPEEQHRQLSGGA